MAGDDLGFVADDDLGFKPDVTAEPSSFGERYDAAKDTIDAQHPILGAAAGAGRIAAQSVLGMAGQFAGQATDLLTGHGLEGERRQKWGEAAANLVPEVGPAGQAVERKVGETVKDAGDVVNQIPGVDTPAVQTILGNLKGAGALAGGAGAAGGLVRKLDTFGATPSTIGRFGEAPAPPKTVPGPITADSLRAEPQRLPEPTPSKAQPPATTPPMASAAPAASQTARAQTPVFEAPTAQGSMSGALPKEKQAAREATLSQLNQDSGGQLPERRNSAIAGDYSETGNDWQYAKGEDEGGQKIKATIAREQGALKSASENATSLTGGTADGTSPAALAERGTIIDRALQGVSDWFDKNISEQYQKADQLAGGAPMQKFDNLSALLADHSQFTGIEGRQLHADIQQVAQQFGMQGQNGFWQPTTVATAEKFRQWVGEQYTPRTGRAIRRVKDAIDSDVASHGGQGLYDAGRALTMKRDQMLEGPTGISRLLANDKTGINRPVPVEGIADNIANMPRDQFEHVVNVLHDSAKLGNGELAEGNAAALNEIRGHLAARLHEAGSSARDGTWDPYKYHATLSKYSLKMPSVFSPEGIQRFKTINEAGNILRMDKSYPGAGAQIAKMGGLRALARDRIAHTIEGGVTGLLGPVGGAALELAGGGKMLRAGVERVLGGGSDAKRAATLKARVQPLGARIPGQRGSVGVYRRAADEGSGTNEAANRVAQERAAGQHRYQIDPDGNVTPLRGVDAVDARAPSGHIIVQRGVGFQPYSVLDRGGLPGNAAHGLLARAQGLGNLRAAEQEPLGARVFGGKQRGAVGNLARKIEPEPENEPATVNIGLHQGNPAEGGRVMSKQEAVKALKAQSVNVGKTSVHTPEGGEPTLVANIHRPLTGTEMQRVLAQTKQSAIPQRLASGEGEMHVAPGHEQIAKEQGWDQYNGDYFRMHDGRTATEHATDFNPEQLERENFTPHPSQTVSNPVRNAYPGIYDKPEDILKRLKVAPEDPIMQQLFGHTRESLYKDTLARGEGDLPGKLPGAAAKPKGSKAATSVMTKENEDRLVGVLEEAKKNLSLLHGMVGWYNMSPLYDAVKRVVGEGAAASVYSRLNHLMAMASPGSDVATEINRGTAANMMASQGKFQQFLKHGGKAAGERGRSFPPELVNISGHPYHRTAQGMPMQQYLEGSGELGMKSPKVPMYAQASGHPEAGGFQTRTPVGDAHWARGVGLADVRTNQSFAASVSNPEMSALKDWYREKVAERAGLHAVHAQALQWGALGGETGVETAVGAPKLEIFAQQVKKAADRHGVTPEVMLERIIRGQAHAG